MPATKPKPKATAAAAAADNASKEQPTFQRKLFTAVLRGLVIFVVLRFAQNMFMMLRSKSASVEPGRSVEGVLTSAWGFGQSASLFVYTSTQAIQTVFNDSELVLQSDAIEFGSFKPELDIELSLNYTLPKGREPADPIFAHVYLVKKGYHPDPQKSTYTQASIAYRRVNLVGTMPKPAATLNLISSSGGKKAPPASEGGEAQTVPYWYPEVRISLVQDESPLQLSMLPPHMRRHMSVTLDGKSYLPTLYMNEFWQLKDKRIILDGEKTEVPLRIAFSPMGMIKFQLLTNFDQSLRMNEELFGGDGETEKLKQMFVDTNPYLLIATLAVSLLHSIFDILAFKNDIQFWRQRDNLQGLSVRSVLINAGFQVIIFLYLLDQETSWLILASMAAGTLIELWKITRVLSVSVHLSHGFIPKLTIKDRATYAQTETQKYDQIAVKYLGMVAAPLLVGYSVYSLVYESHKGWYSWILGTLVGFVYTFGFITMTPQLFINYKLKSIAHMPWRVFVYKALNTFIDDLFAFIIKMPTLHRLACFRDDVVFVIYLYQRWIYPVDKSRPNEYGQVFDKEKIKAGGEGEEREMEEKEEREEEEREKEKEEREKEKEERGKEKAPKHSLRSRRTQKS